jgi:catalase
VWAHAECLPIDVGILELNRNPENCFAEFEQATFSPSNIILGIGLARPSLMSRTF